LKTEATLPRPFGDHLLVAQLGDDPLGSVYRAIHSADEKRFVRLRILQSGELSPKAVLAAVEKLEKRLPELAADVRVVDSYVLPVDAEIRAIQPHAHYRAREVNAWAILPGGARRPLIRIRNGISTAG
jgi:hypothetical protein